MSLNFDVSKIANYEAVTTDPTNPEKWHPTTDALVWLTLAIDMGTITEANWKKFYTRVHLYESIFGAMKRYHGEGGKIVDQPITPADVKQHIGLTTNATTTTDAAFGKRVLRWADERARTEISVFERQG